MFESHLSHASRLPCGWMSSIIHCIKAAPSPEASRSQLFFPCPYRFCVPTQMEVCHDTRPMDCSPDRPASAEPTPGDRTANQASNEVADKPAARNAPLRATGKWRSSIWKHFEKLPGYEEHRRVRCRHCGKVYVCHGCSTGDLWKHLTSAHPDRLDDQLSRSST
jgi:hypothetical protein